MPRLSKSRIMSSLQCQKKLWLEVHRPELVVHSPSTLAAFERGHQVGDLAIALFGKGEGEFIPYEGGLSRAEKQSRALMDGMFRAPVFEATLTHDGVLVREDVLLPAGDSWRIIEVKASTSLKDEYVQDCAIQAWVHRGAGYSFESIHLAHLDNQFVYPGEGDYEGIFTQVDLTEAVRDLQPSVSAWVERAKAVAAEKQEPVVAVGPHCTSPYECPFFAYCWPTDSEYPVHGLAGIKKKLGELVAAGYRDIRDVPAGVLENETHLRILRICKAGEPEILPEAGEFIRGLAYPRYYLDFETVGPAIPAWPGTRPYEALPFQWSCHVEHADGSVDHLEFLDLSGDAPMRQCAERLVAGLGDRGPIVVYTTYEKRVINGLIGRFPDLAEELQGIHDRLVDIAPPIRRSYYHPAMLGSWSLKAVLPTIAPDLDYSALEGVHQGEEASNAYLEAIDPETDPGTKEQLRKQLLRYCEYDTLAMVRLAHFFSRH